MLRVFRVLCAGSLGFSGFWVLGVQGTVFSGCLRCWVLGVQGVQGAGCWVLGVQGAGCWVLGVQGAG